MDGRCLRGVSRESWSGSGSFLGTTEGEGIHRDRPREGRKKGLLREQKGKKQKLRESEMGRDGHRQTDRRS